MEKIKNTLLKSNKMLENLMEKREQMIKQNFKYESEYHAETLSPNDEKFMKLYLMTIGVPGKNENKHTHKKTLTAYVGSSKTSTETRVNKHNRPGPVYEDIRTRCGATQWVLCMVLFIPNKLRNIVSTKEVRKYWEAEHGHGKINRGLIIQKIFGLQLYVLPEIQPLIALRSRKMPKMINGEFDHKF